MQNVTKSVGLLDSIVYGFAASFSAFCNAGGLDCLVSRIKVCVLQLMNMDNAHNEFCRSKTILLTFCFY